MHGNSRSTSFAHLSDEQLLAEVRKGEQLKAVATLAAGLAVFTGLRAEGVAKHSFEIWQVMQLHKRLGISTLILGLMATSWRLAHRDRLTPRARMVTLILGLMMAATLTWGADLGGRLVYGFGVGGTFGQ